MSSLHSQHTFHIPVMGTGFTVDTPLRVARYGISSVISLVDDTLIEEMRRAYAAEYGQPFTPIQKYDEDWRARRITEYLNLVDRIVRQQFEALRASEFAPGSEITRYFELLPDTAPLRCLYVRMQSANGQEKARIQASLRTQIVPGWINVNIMTKLDRANVDRMCEPLPEIYSDALSALRGYANSTLSSGIVLSAGLNRRLYAYFSEFPDFFADETGWIRKQIILKVSDYRSAVIQGKFFAKKGLWVSEYRMESGLNCGGHAFAGNGNLIGPVLAELSSKRQELGDELSRLCLGSLKAQGKSVPAALVPFRVTAQGGIGTAAEDALLRRLYQIDSTGWGTPFLLVPEATQVEPDTLVKLQQAKEHDVYLSDVSPLGVPFHNLRVSQSELNKQQLIEDGNSGSACPLGHLVSNTEFTEQPICTASRQYQALKLAELKALSLSPEELAEQTRRVMAKACICSDLGDTAYVLKGIPKAGGAFPAVCPGPNIAYYDRVASLREMVDHIYGRGNLIRRTDRPHMFIKELNLNIDFLFNLIRETNAGLGSAKDSDIEEFRVNLADGIDYYTELMPSLTEESPPARTHMLVQLEACRQRLSAVMATLLDAPLRRKAIKIPVRKPVAADPLPPPADASGTTGEPVTLLVASHTGNGRNFARRVAAQAQQAGIRVRTVNMGSYPPADLAGEKNLLAIISTYGEGDPPVAAEVLFEYLKSPDAPRLDQLRFSVLALGDKGYIHFCKAGADLDAMLEAAGGHRLYERVDGDVDFHEAAGRWLTGVFEAIAPRKDGDAAERFHIEVPEDEGYSARHPYSATVMSKSNLNGPGSTKETYHIELAVEGAGMEFHPGDACGVVSRNSDPLVGKLLSALQLTGRNIASSGLLLADVLTDMELTVLVPSVIAQHNAFAKSRDLEAILADDERLKAYIHGRDFIDLVKEYPVAYDPEALIHVLRPAPPRLFSITSSQLRHPGRLDLLVGALRYESQGRARQGMASTYLADRIRVGDRIPIFIRPNEGFRMPADPKVPIIMVGAGTGVAPFRAFLQERALLPRSEPVGNSWLFFGNPHAAADFLFQEEWNGHLKSGTLTRLTTAFSRDQQDKVYVHHRILEHASEVYAWMEAGAVVYVSGAKAMAHDVFTALVECARRCGPLSAEDACAYGTRLRRAEHYLEDVYS
jgi:NADPH-dependent sulfite reductase flavoprotein alpha-component